MAAADERNLTATVSIADIAEVGDDRRESVMKFAQGHNMSAQTVHATLHKDLLLLRSQQGERSNCFPRRRRRSDPEHARRSQR